ncbi:hypothetical protein DICVIV_13750 [Dictyocaulus viviparus]|uniref:Uncharacterized protein n=1 Tax=Dictyocaulus viviparus TaxID=29172 RepID=A0A0D8X723_DICVI|nr:hypothetical protein DICVIV_13750 [Dictyocaulus viviparus]
MKYGYVLDALFYGYVKNITVCSGNVYLGREVITSEDVAPELNRRENEQFVKHTSALRMYRTYHYRLIKLGILLIHNCGSITRYPGRNQANMVL